MQFINIKFPVKKKLKIKRKKSNKLILQKKL